MKSVLKPVTQKKTTSKIAAVKAVPAKKTQSWVPSIQIEDVPDEDDQIHSEWQHNPWNILELSNESEDEDNRSCSQAMDVDSNSENEVKVIESPEEDDEAELDVCLLSMTGD